MRLGGADVRLNEADVIIVGACRSRDPCRVLTPCTTPWHGHIAWQSTAHSLMYVEADIRAGS